MFMCGLVSCMVFISVIVVGKSSGEERDVSAEAVLSVFPLNQFFVHCIQYLLFQ